MKFQIQFGKIQRLGAKINQEQKLENYKDCLALCIEFFNVLDDTVERPHQFYIMTAQTMIITLWVIYGSKSRGA